MQKQVLVALAALAFVFPCSAFAASFDGPLRVKNQSPVFLSLNQSYLEPAATESSFSLSLSHSSTYVLEDAAQWSAYVDMELTELNFRYKKDFPGFFEAGVDLPVLRATAGFLDGPLSSYHRAFGFPDYGRSERPKNEFLYVIQKDGAPLIEGENDRVGLGDLRLTLKKKLSEVDPVISVLADLELPTGNANIGYGNGSVDAALALLLDKDLGQDGRLYANLGTVFPGDLKALQTVKLEHFYYAGAGIESRQWPELSLIAQAVVQTSPYPRTGISQIDTTGIILVLGGRYYGTTGSYEFSLTEDPNTSGACDFILNLTFKKRF